MTLLAAAAIALTACGQTKRAEAPSKSAETVVLNWSYWQAEPKAVIEKFNSEHPNIRVDYEMISSDQYINTMNVRLLSGEGPDIFEPRYVDNYATLVDEKRLVDTTDEAYLSNYDPAAIDMIKAPDGRVYGIPVDAIAWVMFYNKGIFTKYNLQIPTNWDDYLEVCRVLKENGVAPTIQGCKDLGQNQFVAFDITQFMNQQDQTWSTRLAKGEAKFTDPDVLAQYQKKYDFIKSGYLYEGSIGMTFIQAWQLFCEGGAAMNMGGNWYSAQAFPQAAPNFEYGVFAIPMNPKGTPVKIPYGVMSSLISINSASKHLPEAKIFFEWLSQPENLELYAKELQSICTAKGVVSDYSKQAAMYSELINANEKYLILTAPTAITADYHKVIQDMIIGNKTGEQAAKELQRKLDEILAQE
jgi:raffinose/stachyose/melibiose transport system substrate-binding protein